MGIAATLADIEYRKELGIGLTYQRLLYSTAKSLWSAARVDYGALSAEIRKLLTDGPTKYYKRAVGELSAYAPRGPK